MHTPDFLQVLLEGTVYDIAKRLFLAAVMTGAVQVVLTYVFHRLKSSREIIALWVGGIVLFSALIYSLGTRPQAPNLVGAVQQVISGPAPGSDHDTITVLALNIINTGTMQTIVKKLAS